MTYQIDASMLWQDWFNDIVRDTLEMYKRGDDLSKSPLAQRGRIDSKINKWHFTCNETWEDTKDEAKLEESLRAREKVLVEVYKSMKKNGYTGTPVYCWWEDDGMVHLLDGFHRLAIMKYLGIDVPVNVETVWQNNCWHTAFNNDHDFPLRQKLLSVQRYGPNTYEPVDDDRVKDYPVDRKDSYARLYYIMQNAVGKTVLDIGCCEGFFAINLARRGYEVTALDNDANKCAITRYLATIKNVKLNVVQDSYDNYLNKNGKYFDNVLYLSVFHNSVFTHGASRAFEELSTLKDRAARLFFEIPNVAGETYWNAHTKPGQKHEGTFGFDGPVFSEAIQTTTGMEMVEKWPGATPFYRPIYLMQNGHKAEVSTKLVKGRSVKKVTKAQWEFHNDWEKRWWYGFQNTFDEQGKQEQYVPFLRLDQYAEQRKFFNMKKLSVLDIGGGPVSLLLRCWNCSKATVIDPCKYPQWVIDRYEAANINFLNIMAEQYKPDMKYDEVWIYNVLQHVMDPLKVIKVARKAGKKIRVFEALEIGEYKGHPHNLTKPMLDSAFGKEGLVENGKFKGPVYYGVFRYE